MSGSSYHAYQYSGDGLGGDDICGEHTKVDRHVASGLGSRTRRYASGAWSPDHSAQLKHGFLVDMPSVA